ncbi:hypothetical protein, partial [Bartonella sp. AP21QHHD]|uniref:hypothetical protein n=1 Tax=Bartonella sp. AP21QHHD TaxID=3243477 RepID=UPI0035D08546
FVKFLFHTLPIALQLSLAIQCMKLTPTISLTLSVKRAFLKKHSFPYYSPCERNPRAKPSHKIVFKGTSKAIERRREVRGTIYRLIQKKPLSSRFFKDCFLA